VEGKRADGHKGMRRTAEPFARAVFWASAASSHSLSVTVDVTLSVLRRRVSTMACGTISIIIPVLWDFAVNARRHATVGSRLSALLLRPRLLLPFTFCVVTCGLPGQACLLPSSFHYLPLLHYSQYHSLPPFTTFFLPPFYARIATLLPFASFGDMFPGLPPWFAYLCRYASLTTTPSPVQGARISGHAP